MIEKKQNPVVRALLYVLLIVLTMITLLPLVWMLSASLKLDSEVFTIPIKWIPETFHWDNYLRVWQKIPFGLFTFNSAKLTVIITIIQVFTCSFAAYGFTKCHFRGRDTLFLCYVATIAIPWQIYMLPQYSMMQKFGLVDTHLGYIMLPAFAAFGVFLLRQFYQGIPNELLEAARWLSYLKPDGQIVTNTQQIDPMPVITGAAQYPENLVEKMKAAGAKVDALDCLKLAEEAGSSKAVNIVLMGRLSHSFALPEEAWLKSLEAMVPAKFLELNKKAFELGKNA